MQFTAILSISFIFLLNILYIKNKFKVKIDIYTLEVLPREGRESKTGKPHSSFHATSKFFSPFKNNLFSSSSSSSSTSHHHGTQYSGPGGSHFTDQNSSIGQSGAKTSNFIHVDTIEITSRDINASRFKLNISSSSIPLTGSLFVNVRCMPSKSIELKGFMTLFEDVNGVGSWDRRWCFLNNYNISYWKYPEDEYRQTPLGVINLTKCLNQSPVTLLPRDVCARKYTIELNVSGEQQSENTGKTYRLSADTKEQANDWCTNMSYALANLKLWNSKNSIGNQKVNNK